MFSCRYCTKDQEVSLKTFLPGSGTIPPPKMEFTIPEHQQRFEGIQKLKFGQSHFIDWDALGEIGQADDVRELVIIGEWDQLLSISDPIRRDITLELLASFSFDRSHADFDKDDTIQF